MKYPIFLCFVILALFTLISSRKKIDTSNEEFWEKERKANSVRKKPLDTLNYISIPLEHLPIKKDTTDEALLEYQEKIIALSKQKIVNLNGITNTDLKLQYGAANITTLMSYDQNFIFLVGALYKWAVRLHELGLKEEAKTVLEFGISCGTDVKGHYVLLAQIYKEDFHPEKINDLIEVAKTLNSIMKNPIITQLEEIREQ